MDIAMVIAILLLFLSGCVAVVVFAARRFGWKSVLLYGIFSILFRILSHFAMSEGNQAAQTIGPLVAAWFVVRILLPHAVKQKMLEDQEIEGKLD